MIFIKCTCIIISIFLFSDSSFPQIKDTISLVNPSFEDLPACCKTPSGWINCGLKRETPPDIQPALDKDGNPFWGVTKDPFDGNTYLGMVVRENGTYERVSQKLIKSFRKGVCYSFSIMLCRSDTYLSASSRFNPNVLKQFTNPVILRIWGSDILCSQKQLLAESILIENTNWTQYDFHFQAKFDMSYFELEANYKDYGSPYNGNVLLDKASNIIEIDCDSLNKN